MSGPRVWGRCLENVFSALSCHGRVRVVFHHLGRVSMTALAAGRRSLWLSFCGGLVLNAACSGSPGPEGVPGSSVIVSAEPAGVNCVAGGARLTSDAGTQFVCNGKDATSDGGS